MKKSKLKAIPNMKKIFSDKKKTTIFLSLVLLMALAVNLYIFFIGRAKESDDGVLKIGLITDVHCYSKYNNDEKKWEINWRCERPMKEFVRQMNGDYHPDFVVELGDMVDGRDKRGEDGFSQAKAMYEQVDFPKYYVLGNHETDNMTKQRWMELVGYDKTNYYFDSEGYRIIMLDANNVEVPQGSGNIIDMSPETPHSYKGMMDAGQLEWLEETLKNSAGLKKIVFVHEPPLTQTIGELRDDIFINPKPLRDMFSNYGVLAVFSGHTEELCDVDIDGVKYFTFKGFHKQSPLLPEEHQYKDEGNFYQIEIAGDKIVVEMFHSKGKEEPYQKTIVSQQTAVCNNGSLPSQN